MAKSLIIEVCASSIKIALVVGYKFTLKVDGF